MLALIFTLSLNLQNIPLQLILLFTFCRERNQLERKTSMSTGRQGDYWWILFSSYSFVFSNSLTRRHYFLSSKQCIILFPSGVYMWGMNNLNNPPSDYYSNHQRQPTVGSLAVLCLLFIYIWLWYLYLLWNCVCRYIHFKKANVIILPCQYLKLSNVSPFSRCILVCALRDVRGPFLLEWPKLDHLRVCLASPRAPGLRPGELSSCPISAIY